MDDWSEPEASGRNMFISLCIA